VLFELANKHDDKKLIFGMEAVLPNQSN